MKLYRSRKGIFLGVCKGLEERTGFPVKYYRIAVIVLLVIPFTRWWTLAAYLIGAILMPVRHDDERVFAGVKDNIDDLKDDVVDFAKREYRDFKDALKSQDPPKKS